MLEVLRKFGISRCDLSTMIGNVDFFLRLLTLRIDSRNKNSIPTPVYLTTAISIACYFYVYLISMAWFVAQSASSGAVLPALIVFSLGVSSELGTLKLVCMFCYQKKVRTIVTECLARDAQIIPNTRFYNNLMKTLRFVKKRAMVFWLVLISNGVIYVVFPLFLPGRHLMQDIFIIYGLEPMFESPNYEIAFIILTIGVYVTVYLPANITAFLIIISGYVEAQMLAWSEELLYLWEDAENHYEDIAEIDIAGDSKNVAINELVRQRLKEIIKEHSSNVDLLRQIEDVFRFAIAVEFMLLIVGLLAELLGGLENTYMQLPYALMQVSMDCLTGQRLMDASLAFERSVYDCRWEMMDSDNRKYVLMILRNSQKTMTLTAGGITTLSFSSLMSIIKSIYSTYTTLRSTMT